MIVSPLVTAVTTWAAVFAAALAGMWIGSRLPEDRRTPDNRSVVTISMAMVSTLTALVLGLLLSVANTSFTANQQQLTSTSSDIIRLDHMFKVYGPDADHARRLLREYAAAMLQDLFPDDGGPRRFENPDTVDLAAKAENRAALLVPATDTQRWLQPRMLDLSNKLIEEHFNLVKQRLESIPVALIVLLLVWLCMLFASYGLYAPRNLNSYLVLLLTSGAASGAILLILELEAPDRGIVRLSPDPITHAIAVMDSYTKP